MIQQPAVSRRELDAADGEPYTNSTVVAAVDSSYQHLTPYNAVLVLIDYQIGPLWELNFAETRHTVAALAKASHGMRLPTIVTAIAPEVWGSVIPELSDAVGDAPHILRTEVNAWENADVREAIVGTGRKKLIMAGGAAPVAVALCALSAVQAGFEVYTPVDASAQFSHATITRVSRDGVIVTTTALLLAELSRGEISRRSRPRRY